MFKLNLNRDAFLNEGLDGYLWSAVTWLNKAMVPKAEKVKLWWYPPTAITRWSKTNTDNQWGPYKTIIYEGIFYRHFKLMFSSRLYSRGRHNGIAASFMKWRGLGTEEDGVNMEQALYRQAWRRRGLGVISQLSNLIVWPFHRPLGVATRTVCILESLSWPTV